ncbi:MAG TPA: hypothetical protein VG368_03530 [Acidimicrobiales bacterium]|nr:hypothetical protein [Acidimicrobiales bacterium]
MTDHSAPAPIVLEALRGDLDSIDASVKRLEDERDPTTRADLAMELIRVTSLVVDTMERSVYGEIEGQYPEIAEAGREGSNRLREAMVPVDHRTRHVTAVDVHRSDPEGFEQELAVLRRTVNEVRSWESRVLYPCLAGLSAQESASLADHTVHARKHASEHPAPAGRIVRTLHKVGAIMDHYPDIADRHE